MIFRTFDRLKLAALRLQSRSAAKSLTLVSQSKITGGFAVYCVVRNERDQLPQFLAHYRDMGFDRFTIVDNDSSDGTADFLAAQNDVTLYHTKASFRSAGAGSYWRNALIEREGLNRWVCVVDADEHLVASKHFGRTVQQITARLEQLGHKRLFAPLLDLYRLGDAEGQYFDATPDLTVKKARGCELWGGVRMRLARKDDANQNGPILSKYPLTYFDRETLYAEPHFPLPHRRNDGLILGRLLHRKMTHWTVSRIETSIKEGQYWKGSREYQAYRNWISEELRCDQTTLYRDPEDLVAAGLLLAGPLPEAPQKNRR